MSEKIRAEFEHSFPVPLGVEWRDGAYHISKPKQITLAAHMFYLGRWETWQACIKSIPTFEFCNYRFEGCRYYDAECVDDALNDIGMKVI